eukprot:3686631-Alexandrium_andersonii.AAC.1
MFCRQHRPLKKPLCVLTHRRTVLHLLAVLQSPRGRLRRRQPAQDVFSGKLPLGMSSGFPSKTGSL